VRARERERKRAIESQREPERERQQRTKNKRKEEHQRREEGVGETKDAYEIEREREDKRERKTKGGRKSTVEKRERDSETEKLENSARALAIERTKDFERGRERERERVECVEIWKERESVSHTQSGRARSRVRKHFDSVCDLRGFELVPATGKPRPDQKSNPRLKYQTRSGFQRKLEEEKRITEISFFWRSIEA